MDDIELLELLVNNCETNLLSIKNLIIKLKNEKNYNFRSSENLKQNEDNLGDNCRKDNLLEYEYKECIPSLLRDNNEYYDSDNDSCDNLWNRRIQSHKNYLHNGSEFFDLMDNSFYDLNISKSCEDLEKNNTNNTNDTKDLYINPLLRIPYNDRDKLLYKMFQNAKKNVISNMNITEDHPNYTDELNKESDRLLHEWINYQYKK